MSRDFDFLFTGKAVNRTAKNVLSHGVSYHTRINPQIFHSEKPNFKTVDFTGPCKLNLTGKKIGRLIIVGYVGKSRGKSNRPGRWLVKCLCGKYEIRTTTSLNSEHDDKMCAECLYTEKIRRNFGEK